VFRVAWMASALLLISGMIACSAGADAGSTTTRPGGGNAGGSGNNGSGSGSGGTAVVIGGSTGSGGTGSPACGAILPVTYRDFKGNGESGGHPDFEISARAIRQPDGQIFKGWNDIGCGLIEPTIGANNKPVFYGGQPDVAQGGPTPPIGAGRQQRVVEGPGCYPATSGVCRVGTCKPWDITIPSYVIQDANSFNAWFNAAPGYNMEIPGELVLVEDPPGSGTFVYDTNAFFPLTDQGFGNTPFTFRGDDDLWIFVNGRLALDVGGLHQALEGSINFDAQAGALGITPGNAYQMDIFHAERQTLESNFRIETNIRCFEPVVF
jgi:fibro-slime domain-containing protein